MCSKENLVPIKCQNCPKVLMHIDVKDGVISKDCPKCGYRNVITVIDSRIDRVLVSKY